MNVPNALSFTRFRVASPSVSVCVPTFQGEAYLRACLESIARQTWEDLEVIVVDDDSKDATLEIASEFARRDPRFHVHRNSVRLGLVPNWNRSLELSQGTWIKLVFQDDLLAPECLQRLLDGCRERGRPFAFCRRDLLFDEQTAPETIRAYRGHEALLDEVYRSVDEFDPQTFSQCCAKLPGWNVVGEPTAVLFHRSMLQKFGTFDPGLVQLCDAEYWTRLGTNVGIVHIAEKLASFRVHASSTTANNVSKRQFRMQTLDPLILSYLVLRRPYYRTLRRTLYKECGRRRTWFSFADRLFRAWKNNGPLSARSSSSDRERKSEWSSVFGVYPGLRGIVVLGLVLAVLQALRRGPTLNPSSGDALEE